MLQGFIEVLRSTADEQRALYSTVAADLKTRAENVEKDLYVCWILDFLFTDGLVTRSGFISRAARA